MGLFIKNIFALLLLAPIVFIIEATPSQAAPFLPDSSTTNTYDSLLTRLDTIRSQSARDYKTSTRALKDSLLIKARNQFISFIVDSIAPHWMGTAWDFNGTSEQPGEGMIACGYFVSTILRDAGLNVERIRMAQQASEKIVKTLATKNDTQRFRNTEFTTFIDTMNNWGFGLYVVGLDYHVGFLYHDSSHVWFIHSSYIEPRCVVRESAKTSLILASSKYRVVGKISENNGLIRKWLLGEKVKTER